MANVFDVARYILDSIGEVSTMKLQKLCYYAQAWHMVWSDGTPLFDEDFEAWANGPVCDPLFQVHKGKFTVVSADISNELLSNNLTETETTSIDTVIEFYGDKTGAWLSELTHKERPWKDVRARNTLSVGERCSEIIPKAEIFKYYSNL